MGWSYFPIGIVCPVISEEPKIFEVFVNRFVPSRPLDEAKKVIAGSIKDAVVWEVTIDKVSGKAKAKQPFFGKVA